MLPATHRLKGKKIFNDLFRFGKTFSNDLLMMKAAVGEKDAPTKFGFAASLKYSKKAVERNKAKRRMREAVRSIIAGVKPGWHVVFFISPKFTQKKITPQLVRENIENLLKKAKIYPHANSKTKL